MATLILANQPPHRIVHKAAPLLALAITFTLAVGSASAVVPPPACTQQSQFDPSQSLTAGNAAFETGDIDKAEAEWLRIHDCARGTSQWPKAVFNLGLLEHKRRNFPKAIAYFNEVLGSHPNDEEAGANLMETNRNYSYRSAMAISECYEAMGAFGPALRYARLAKTKYRYYSWCGTCLNSAAHEVNKRIAYLAVRASRVHIWAGVLVVGLVALRIRRRKRPADACAPTDYVSSE